MRAVASEAWVRVRLGELTGELASTAPTGDPAVLADQLALVVEGVYASVQALGATARLDGAARWPSRSSPSRAVGSADPAGWWISGIGCCQLQETGWARRWSSSGLPEPGAADREVEVEGRDDAGRRERLGRRPGGPGRGDRSGQVAPGGVGSAVSVTQTQ